MRGCLIILVGMVLLYYFVQLAFYFIFHTGVMHDDSLAPDLGQKAEQDGNQVVECRYLVDRFGHLVPEAQAGTWHNVVPLLQDGNSTPLRATVLIIFVHGFNTSLNGAIAKGNAILKALRTSGRTSVQGLKFFTFCWRSDFELTKELPIELGSAECSAENEAPSLASFIKRLHCLYPSAKIILLTHSLGARVALEALHNLWKERKSAWIDCLLMVQPAVEWSELYEGYFSAPNRPPLSVGVGLEPWVEHRTGRYSVCINAAQEVVVTQSPLDSVLSQYFHGGGVSIRHPWNIFGYQWATSVYTIPDITIALGSPYDKAGWKMHHKAYREIFLSPDQKSPAFNNIHENWNEDQTIVDLIYNTVLAKYFPAP
jgi:hypothetical protein